MNFDLPWGVTREPVIGRAVVATSQPLATQAGMDMLARGGTAIDAAIATAATLTVVEPTSNGLGSDAFAMWWDGKSLHGLNASGRSPARLDHERLLHGDAMVRLGWDAVTVPGAVSAWIDLWRAGGTLDLATLLAPAIGHARDGFLVSPQTARGWQRAVDRYRSFDAWMATFAPNGTGPAIGEHVRLPDHADTLEAIAASEGEAFYRGHLAQAMEDAASAADAALRTDDLAAHAVEHVTPMSTHFGGIDLHELPPNGQGIAALTAASVLQQLECAAADPDDPAIMHLQIEAMKLGFADAATHVADPERLIVDPTALLAPDRIAELVQRLDHTVAQPLCANVPQWSSTVYLATADAHGRAVSFIQSNYEGFGSGIVIPGTGIALQNRGAGFVLDPNHPNAVRGGARPYHTIIPGFTTVDGQPHMAFGVMGGPMQPQGHLQVLARIAHGWNPQAALDAPRWRFEGGLRVAVEPQMPESTIESLRAMGHDITVAPQRDVSFGGGQAAMRHGTGWIGASDCRRDGCAAAR